MNDFPLIEDSLQWLTNMYDLLDKYVKPETGECDLSEIAGVMVGDGVDMDDKVNEAVDINDVPNEADDIDNELNILVENDDINKVQLGEKREEEQEIEERAESEVREKEDFAVLSFRLKQKKSRMR